MRNKARFPCRWLAGALALSAAWCVSSTLAGERERRIRLAHEDDARVTREAPERLTPFAIRLADPKTAPSTGVLRPHPEYAPMAGVLFEYDRFGWPTIVRDMVAELTQPGYDETAWVIVEDSTQRNHAQNAFENAGADLAKVTFLTIPNESIWLRDYGPQFVRLDETIAIVDLRYFTNRPNDNFVPKFLAETLFDAPTYDLGLYHFGGNYLGLGDGQGFAAGLVTFLNQEFGHERVLELFGEYHGIHTMHILPTLPGSVDATGHIDMWFQFADADTVVIADFVPGSNAQATTIADNAATYMQDLGFEVFRVPALNAFHPDANDTHFTYTNSFRVNDRIFVPVYGSGGSAHASRDAQALAVWEQAAPDATIVPIDTWELIYAAGAVHCVVMQVPRYAALDPAATVLSPAGGEVLVAGETQRIAWNANDDEAVTGIDIELSTNGGVDWGAIALGLADDGQHDWVVPDVATDNARFRIVAHDAEGRAGATTGGDVAMLDASKRRWDFAANAGVNRWAWGHETASWADVAGRRQPLGAANELSNGNYNDLATSNATGGDGDGNRYRSPIPSSGKSSTHTFEFTVDADPALMRELAIEWEGYGDACYQVEMYVWDHVTGDWCDGAGNCGQRRYLDNTSGNEDQVMRGFIRADFERYLDEDHRVTVLVYAARPAQETFHDYVAVSVTQIEDTDNDSVPDGQDCAPADGTSWALPGEVTALTLARQDTTAELTWTAPAELGGTFVTYDVLTTGDPTGFDAATCLVDGGAAAAFDDPAPLAPNELRAYLVRATNGCGNGGLGDGTGGNRPASSCP